MGVYFKSKGDFGNTERYLQSLLRRDYMSILEKYGELGVEALRAATPVDTGLAASSWSYEIRREDNCVKLIWSNSDIEGNLNIAVIVDRGHCTKSGTWVPGRHFIDDAISPIIAQIAKEVAV